MTLAGQIAGGGGARDIPGLITTTLLISQWAPRSAAVRSGVQFSPMGWRLSPIGRPAGSRGQPKAWVYARGGQLAFLGVGTFAL